MEEGQLPGREVAEVPQGTVAPWVEPPRWVAVQGAPSILMLPKTLVSGAHLFVGGGSKSRVTVN